MASSLNVLAVAALQHQPRPRVAANRKPSTCRHCGVECATALQLERHAKQTRHEAWVCTYEGCGVKFRDRSAFSTHKSRHRQLQKDPDAGHQCKGCGHRFPRKHNLKEHLELQRCKSRGRPATARSDLDPDQVRHTQAVEALPEVISFSPVQGPAGCKLCVLVDSDNDLEALPTSTLTVVFGSTACDATVQKHLSQYALTVDVPPHDSTGWESMQVPLRLHYSSSTLLVMMPFGSYTYTDATVHSPEHAIVGEMESLSGHLHPVHEIQEVLAYSFSGSPVLEAVPDHPAPRPITVVTSPEPRIPRESPETVAETASGRQNDVLFPDLHRDYILDLANPERDETNAPTSARRRAEQRLLKTFQCHLCPKRFRRVYNLRSHLRTHTDERPYICELCDKTFARQSDRKRHKVIHTDEKKFVCKGVLKNGATWGCGRRFAQAGQLGRHQRCQKGRECIRPFLDEKAQAMRRQWAAVGG